MIYVTQSLWSLDPEQSSGLILAVFLLFLAAVILVSFIVVYFRLKAEVSQHQQQYNIDFFKHVYSVLPSIVMHVHTF